MRGRQVRRYLAGFLVLILLSSLLMPTYTTKASTQDIALGKPITDDNKTIVIIGDEGKFYLDYDSSDSVFYGRKDKIQDVTYSVTNDTDGQILTVDQTGNYKAVGFGKAYVKVTLHNIIENNVEDSTIPYIDEDEWDDDWDDDYEIENNWDFNQEYTEGTFVVYVCPDMEKVKPEKTHFIGYKMKSDYSFYDEIEFSTKINGLEGIWISDYGNKSDCIWDFSCQESGSGLSIEYSIEDGILKFECEGVGSKTIVMRINGKEFTFTITVKEVELSCGTSLYLIKGKSKQLKVKNASGKITWASSNPSVVSVTSKGKVKAKKTGNAIITATIGDSKLGCVVMSLTKKRKQVIDYGTYIGTHWKYSQPKRMQKGYYDCSALVWKAYQKEGKNFGNKNYAPVAADIAKWCANNKKMVKGNIEKNIQKLKYVPGALTFKTGSDNGRYKGIYHVEMFTGYYVWGFDSKGTPYIGTMWAARPNGYGYGEIFANL